MIIYRWKETGWLFVAVFLAVGFLYVQILTYLSHKQFSGFISLFFVVFLFVAYFLVRAKISIKSIALIGVFLIITSFWYLTSPIEIRLKRGNSYQIQTLPAVYVRRDSSSFKSFLESGNVEGRDFVVIEGQRTPAHIQKVIVITLPLN